MRLKATLREFDRLSEEMQRTLRSKKLSISEKSEKLNRLRYPMDELMRQRQLYERKLRLQVVLETIDSEDVIDSVSPEKMSEVKGILQSLSLLNPRAKEPRRNAPRMLPSSPKKKPIQQKTKRSGKKSKRKPTSGAAALSNSDTLSNFDAFYASTSSDILFEEVESERNDKAAVVIEKHTRGHLTRSVEEKRKVEVNDWISSQASVLQRNFRQEMLVKERQLRPTVDLLAPIC